MIDLISDRPLLIQIYDWLYFLGKCRDGRDFSKTVLGRCPGYFTAYKTMNFKPSAHVLISIRTTIIEMAKAENNQSRRLVLTELVDVINDHLLGKGGAA